MQEEKLLPNISVGVEVFTDKKISKMPQGSFFFISFSHCQKKLLCLRQADFYALVIQGVGRQVFNDVGLPSIKFEN